MMAWPGVVIAMQIMRSGQNQIIFGRYSQQNFVMDQFQGMIENSQSLGLEIKLQRRRLGK